MPDNLASPDTGGVPAAAASPGPAGRPGSPAPPAWHHIAVQTADLDASISWYEEFFDARTAWTLDTFSELTRRRLPGITRLAELTVGGLRFHLFTRGPEHSAPPPADTAQFQHVCLGVPSPEALEDWHDRWSRLYSGGRYRFARPEPATGIVVDPDGTRSFYAYDVNGVEFEFTYQPGGGDEPAG
ncbi:VOC family protein [Streptomyces sp. NPDC004783]|uniref:VOC family protein n=1 Tax=unclassified Streptomyces TaxID=2593676 RepID=UPI0033B9CA8D